MNKQRGCEYTVNFIQCGEEEIWYTWWKAIQHYLFKVNIHIPYDSAIQLSTNTREILTPMYYKYENVQCSNVSNRTHKPENNPKITGKRMDKFSIFAK